MPNKWTVAFAGPGLVTEEDVLAQLDNWWAGTPEDTEFTLILPDKITRTHKGLGNVAAYITDTFGDDDASDDGFTTMPLSKMVTALADNRAARDEVFLVLLWGENGDEPCRDVLEAAIEAGIPVKDLTSGLDDLQYEDDTTEHPPHGSESQSKSRRRRTQGESTPQPPEPAESRTAPRNDSPDATNFAGGRRTRGKPREPVISDLPMERSEAQEPDAGNDPTMQVDQVFQEVSLTAEKISEIVGEAMRVAWIKVFSLMLEALETNGNGHVVPTEPEKKRGPGRPPGSRNKSKSDSEST